MASISKVSVSELPVSQEITDNDYLIIQEPSRTSRIKFDDFVIGQQNTSFYPEIIQLKSTIAVLSAIIAANSANWIDTHTSVSTTSSYWSTGYVVAVANQIDISNMAVLSGSWTDTYTTVYTSTGEWDNAFTNASTVYTTVNTNSAVFADAASVYTTVNTNSGSTW